ncbi:MAG TPA: ADP-ribosylglycohydrolase family protein, partial [Terriglobia bacterium]|nr:ADP-ribosylglycohydrolase family protein [Terriglobia bacterium]
MTKKASVLTLILALVALSALSNQGLRKISRQLLEDKIRGGWAGKMIGVSYGAPTEFRFKGQINDSKLTWSPERVS